MVNYICPKCNKVFKQKGHYVDHTENKKNACDKSDFLVPPKSTNLPPKTTKFLENLIKEPEQTNNNCICIYCDKTFARSDSLQRHLNGRCKSKENHDELEKLKEEMKFIIEGFKNLQTENINLKNEIQTIQKENNKKKDKHIINNNTQIINNNDNKQINNGIIQNNIIVQFGEEDIDKIDIKEAMKTFLSSTGGNIVSNMLKYINLNDKYPENNNLCITDKAREIVKIHNGKKFVYKKFKNAKDDIVNKAVKNTKKIIKKYKDDDTIIKTQDRKDKIKINEVSLKLIDGISGETIVREEINEKEPKVKNEDSETEEERDFTFEERLRVQNLDRKSKGLQDITYENIKEELYNAKDLLL